MTPQELAKEAQLFLDFYIQGSSEAVEAFFPNAHKPGIRFRKPAVLGIRHGFAEALLQHVDYFKPTGALTP